MVSELTLSPTLFHGVGPSVTKSEESTHQEQQNDQDAETQYDQAFTVTSSVRLDESELMAYRDAPTGRSSVEDITRAARDGVEAQKFWDIPSRDSCQGGGQQAKTSGSTKTATENPAGEP